LWHEIHQRRWNGHQVQLWPPLSPLNDGLKSELKNPAQDDLAGFFI
jgi:hypothetical protein